MRALVAHKVGGEPMLASLIASGAAIAYKSNGIDFVRLKKHMWNNITEMGYEQQIGGVTSDQGAINDHINGLDALTDAFNTSFGQDGFAQDAIPDIDIMMATDPRNAELHASGLQISRLSLMNSPAEVPPPSTRLETINIIIKLNIFAKPSQRLLITNLFILSKTLSFYF